MCSSLRYVAYAINLRVTINFMSGIWRNSIEFRTRAVHFISVNIEEYGMEDILIFGDIVPLKSKR